MVSSENAQNIVLGIFDLFEILDFENLWCGFLLKIARSFKGFDDIWRFLGGHLKKKPRNSFFWFRGCIRGCLIVWWEWAGRKLFLVKGTFSQIYGAMVKLRYIFPYNNKVVKMFSCTRRGVAS